MAEKKEDKIIRKKPVIFELYTKFRAIPKPFRAEAKIFEGCSIDADFSKRFKVSEQTLSAWKKEDEFKEKKKKHLRQWGQDRTPNVISAVYKRILKTGRAREAELWLEYIEGWRRGVDVDTSVKRESNNDNNIKLSNEDKELIDKAIDKAYPEEEY